MKKYTFSEVFDLDEALQQLANYEIAGGKILTPKNMEEYKALQRKVVEKFNYFKDLIQNGDCTFDFIKQNVLRKNGAYGPLEDIDLDAPEAFTYEDTQEINIGSYFSPQKIPDSSHPHDQAENYLNEILNSLMASFGCEESDVKFFKSPNVEGTIEMPPIQSLIDKESKGLDKHKKPRKPRIKKPRKKKKDEENE